MGTRRAALLTATAGALLAMTAAHDRSAGTCQPEVMPTTAGPVCGLETTGGAPGQAPGPLNRLF